MQGPLDRADLRHPYLGGRVSAGPWLRIRREQPGIALNLEIMASRCGRSSIVGVTMWLSPYASLFRSRLLLDESVFPNVGILVP